MRVHPIASALAVALAATAAGAAPRTDFDRTFATAGEPAALHYRVLFAGGGVHRMDVWRDRERRIKRATDAAVVTVATREGIGAGYDLAVLDRTRGTSTRIARTDLYRLGNFTDWFDLGHGLRHPRGGYRLAAGLAPVGLPRPAEACRWYDLSQGSRTTRICWGTAARIPLLIVTSDRRLVWRVVGIDRHPLPAGLFDVHDEGMVRTDAGDD